ncbi:tail Collar domain-containing protein [Brevifollis gellanilyticus]|uniref:Tail Collar domain-containing protein n=2 Tax=Brevifollis gellanilyticus TaxID=748831 RepID=A0A512M7F7_9BACT|nr:tail Collar domain-containing protein [Brevifollis gellanilyticus]
MFGGNFPPNGWAFCDGQTLPISENEVLFNLIGTTYGGDGQETFNLPNLQGRVPIHQGTGGGLQTYVIGESAGVESVTLNTQQIPVHTHAFLGSTAAGNNAGPSGNILATSTLVTPYNSLETPGTNMAASAIQQVGGSQPHENMQPFLCISFIISLFGVFPSQT